MLGTCVLAGLLNVPGGLGFGGVVGIVVAILWRTLAEERHEPQTTTIKEE